MGPEYGSRCHKFVLDVGDLPLSSHNIGGVLGGREAAKDPEVLVYA